jgi:hypothetical protein
MTALAANRDTPEIKWPRELAGALTLLNDAVLFAGGLVAIDYTDELQPAADTAGLKVIGRAPLGMDNAADGLSSKIERGIFRFGNSATYPLPRSAIGQVAYVEDDQTVAGYSTNLVSAGLVYDVDADGVWVDLRAEALAAAWERRPLKIVAAAETTAVGAAVAFEGRTIYLVDYATIATLTLPSAVAGMRVGFQRKAATAAHDVKVQCATGDKIQASDAVSAAGKACDNTVDAVSGIVIWRAVDDTLWALDNPLPNDLASWVKNDA